MVKRGIEVDLTSRNNLVTPMMTEWSSQVSVDNEQAKYCWDSFSSLLGHGLDNGVKCYFNMMLNKMQYNRLVF